MSALTATTVLFGDADAARTLARMPGWHGVVRRVCAPLPPAARELVGRELSAALAGLIGLDLSEVLMTAWRGHGSLAAAAHATLADAGAVEIVHLVAHRIAVTRHPYVEVVVNATSTATVHFDLGVTFDVDGVLATVRHGRLVAVRSGACVAGVTLSCAGHVLAARRVAIDPVITVGAAEGVALLPDVTPGVAEAARTDRNAQL